MANAATARAVSKPASELETRPQALQDLNKMVDNNTATALRVDEVNRTRSAINNLFHTVLRARGLCQCRKKRKCNDFATRADQDLFRSIKQVIEQCLTELSPDDKFAFKKKTINNRVYWYAVWWDTVTKKKKEKYVSAGVNQPPESKGRQIVIEEKLRRQAP